MQLVAYGAQDIYLTGSPQITFFKVVYRRHTNFAMESIQQTFNGSANFGNRVTCTISRNGDLVHNMWVEATLPAGTAKANGAVWGSNVGHRLINNVELEIGGQKIDKHYADWLEVWSQLTVTPEKTTGYNAMVDNDTAASGIFASYASLDTGVASGNADNTALNIGVMFGLNATDVVLRIKEEAGPVLSAATNASTWAASTTIDAAATKASTSSGSATLTVTLKDADSTLKAAVGNADAKLIVTIVGGKYQVTFASGMRTDAAVNTVAAKKLYVPLQFWFCRNPGLALPLIALQYHEVKLNLEFETFANSVTSSMNETTGSLSDVSLWCDYIYLDTDERRRFAQVSHEYLIEQLQFTGNESAASAAVSLRLNFNHPVKELVWVGTTSTSGVYDGTLSLAKLQLNGHDRFAERNGAYFNKVQTYQHHTNIPSGNVYLYSFALKPEEHQPSGTCNFSRIDNATLQLTWAGAVSGRNAKVFAVNYNVLRVMSGMGGLAYSN